MSNWRCNVCGYISSGENPPKECPICGVGPEEFSLEQPVDKDVRPSKRWKCQVCDYIHEGDQPPASCPLCGVGPEYFVLLEDDVKALTEQAVQGTGEGTIRSAVDKISYGLYILTSKKDNKINGQCINTFFQLTDQPVRVAFCLNKNNLTHEYVTDSLVFAVSILGDEHSEMVRRFGYKSGREADKFANLNFIAGQNGCPILQQSIAFLEGAILPERTVDVGTHTLFVADITSGRTIAEAQPLTYALYRQNKMKKK